jgi:hypothetical protein
MAIPQSKISMNLVLQPILKLLSRPVVCANFQGLEANTFFNLAELIKATVDLMPLMHCVTLVCVTQTRHSSKFKWWWGASFPTVSTQTVQKHVNCHRCGTPKQGCRRAAPADHPLASNMPAPRPFHTLTMACTGALPR